MKRLQHFVLLYLLFTSAASAQGNALSFDGTSNYVSVPTFSWPAGGAITIEFWNYVASVDAQASLAFRIGDGTTGSIVSSHAPWADKNLYWDYGASSGIGRLVADYTAYLDKWTHVALVSEGNGGSLRAIYLNGNLVASAASSDGPDIALTGLYIGGVASLAYHKGQMDEFRIWNVARTQAQIQSAYRTTLTGSETGLAGYWKFDEGSGTTTADASGNGNTGTLINAPAWVATETPLLQIPASNILFSNVSVVKANIGWTNGGGTRRAVFISQGTTGSPLPVNATTYTANAIFGSGQQIGNSGWYCVYNDTGNAVVVRSLAPGEIYRVAVCEYIGASGSESYFSMSGANNPENSPPVSSALTIANTNPALNANNVLPGTTISVVFEQALNGSTVNTGTVFVSGSHSGSHTGALALSDSNTTITFTPSTPFKSGEIVSVTLTGSIQSSTGVSLTNGYSVRFTIKSNAAPADFGTSSTVGTDAHPVAIVAADFNGDGSIDIATANANGNSVSILLNNGNGSFSDASRFGNGTAPQSLVAGDFDGNGTIDLAVLSIINGNGGYLTIYSNNSSGAFNNTYSRTIGYVGHSITAGDFDNDGHLDLATPVYYETSSIYILKNDGSGQFPTSTTVSANYYHGYQIVSGDFNNDGLIDLATSNYDYQSATTFVNTGNGAFANTNNLISVFLGAYFLCPADFTGDGWLDLAISNYYSAGVNTAVNTANWNFNTDIRANIVSPYTSGAIVASDLDGDGYQDVALCGYGMLRNNGSGGFSGAAHFATTGADAIVSADFNGDGTMDIATANSYGNTVTILLNTFTQAKTIAFENTGTMQTTINWTNGNGARRAVFVKHGSTGTAQPVNNTTYTADTTFGSGTQIGNSGWFCVYNGVGTGVTVAGLAADDTSRVMVIEYLGSAGGESYFTTMGIDNPVNVRTFTVQASNLLFSILSSTQTSINWSNGTGTGRAVFVLHGQTGSPSPAAGTTFAANATFGSGAQIGGSGWYCVYNGTGTSVQVSGLTTDETYRAAVVEYNGIHGAETYLGIPGQGNPANLPLFSSAGLVGNAIRFDGNSSYVNIPGFAWSTGGPITIEFWNYVASGDQQVSLAFRLGDGTSGSTVSSHAPWEDGTMYWDYGDISGAGRISVNYTPYLDQWTHVAFVSQGNGGNFRGIYLNGNLVASTASSDGPDIPLTGLTIGGVGGVAYHKGNMDDFRIWSVVRSQTEIQDHKNTTLNGSEAGLAGYWRFDEGTGTTVVDASGKGNTGSIMGTALWLTPSTAPVTGSKFQADSVSFTNPAVSSATINWLKGNGSKRVVFVYQGTSGSPTIADGTTYTADTVFGSGTQIGSSGWYCVYNGTGSNVNITGLTSGQVYRAFVCEYNGNAGSEAYFTTLANKNPQNRSAYVPPFLLLTASPANNASTIAANTTIKVTFNKIMQTDSLNIRTVIVSGSVSGRHSGTISFSNGDSSITFTPLIPFSIGETVTVNLTDNIKGGDGFFFANGYHFCFLIKPVTAVVGLSQTATLATATYPFAGVVADFNADGRPDFATISLASNSISVSLNNGDGTFSLTTIGESGAGSIVAADLNNDGIPDLAVGNQTAYTMRAWINNGNGTFTQGTATATGGTCFAIAAGDLNGDGYADLIVGNSNEKTLSVLLNNGNGTFTATTVGTNGQPRALAIADVNGDGTLDVIAANSNDGGGGFNSSVNIFTNSGNGTLTLSSTPACGSGPISIACVDFNGDGYIDIATANYASGTTSILLNNGAGIFTAAASIATGTNPYNIVTGDFNGDGAPDLAVTNRGSSTVSLLLNNGSGNFTVLSTLSPGTSPYFSMTADFNSDGTTDLGVATYNTSTLSMFTNSTGPLPVELTSFTATSERLNVRLKWETATEANNYGYEIQQSGVADSSSKSKNTPVWIKVGFVAGAGYSNSAKEYSFADHQRVAGKNAYRLKQIDNDGKFTFSKAIEVMVGVAPHEFILSQNYPNPFNPSTSIEFTVPSNGRAALKVFNMLGQEVATLFEGTAEAGMYNQAQFNAANMVTGVFVLRLEFGGKVQVKKMMLIK